MPTYEYLCENNKCSVKLDIFQKISDPVILECPQCKQQTLQRLISAASFKLKGSGWYETDFKGSNNKKTETTTTTTTDLPVEKTTTDE